MCFGSPCLTIKFHRKFLLAAGIATNLLYKTCLSSSRSRIPWCKSWGVPRSSTCKLHSDRGEKIGKLRMAKKRPHQSTDKGESLVWWGRKTSIIITIVVRVGLTYHVRGCLGWWRSSGKPAQTGFFKAGFPNSTLGCTYVLPNTVPLVSCQSSGKKN